MSVMRQTCMIDGCDAYVMGHGLCQKHYARKRRTGSTDNPAPFVPATCSVYSCDKPASKRGLCKTCYSSQYQKARRIATKAATERRCTHCQGVIPPERRARNGADVIFCSPNCKQNSYTADGRYAEQARARYLKNKYGLAVEQVDEMCLAGCSICGTTEWTGKHKIGYVDHNHATGEVRGILCAQCNVGIGMFGDDPERMRRAADYVELRHCAVT